MMYNEEYFQDSSLWLVCYNNKNQASSYNSKIRVILRDNIDAPDNYFNYLIGYGPYEYLKFHKDIIETEYGKCFKYTKESFDRIINFFDRSYKFDSDLIENGVFKF